MGPSAPSGPAGAPSPGRGGGGGPGGGGFALGPILAKLAAGLGALALTRDTLATAGSIAGAATGGISSRLEQILFGEMGPNVKGGQRAASEVAQQFGLAQGLGILPAGAAQTQFEFLSDLYQREEIGKRELEVGFKGQIAEDTGTGLLERIAVAAEAIVGFFS